MSYARTFESSSASTAAPSMVTSCDEAGPSSAAANRRFLATSSLEPIDTQNAASRSRGRSIGRSSDAPLSAILSPLPLHLHDLDRGPGTPDFTLGNPMRPARLVRAQSSSAVASSSTVEASSSPRPRLSGLRSFFGSFVRTNSTEASTTPSSSSKLRSSSDFEEEAIVGGASASERFQGLSASAVALDSVRRPMQVLAMPAARPAGPEGLRGLNDDSPPLTPTSEDQSAEENLHRQPYHAPRHAWSQAQAAADAAARNATFTPSVSSAASGRASPVFSTFSESSNGTFSPPTRPGSSIPPSTLKVTPSAGLLPSHLISPPATPPPGKPLSAPMAELLSISPSAALRSLLRRAQRALGAARGMQLPPLRPHLPALMALLLVFVASTMCIVLGLSTLPIVMPKHLTSLTLDEIREACMSLRNYSRSSTKAGVHTLAVLSAFFAWKQAFTVPGSLIMNVVFGAMYGTVWATLYTSILTSLGGVCCYLLVRPLAPLLVGLPGLSKPLAAMRRALAPTPAPTRAGNPLARPGSAASRRRSLAERRSANRHNRRSSTIIKIAAAQTAGSSNVWSYLLVLRVLPVVPYGLMNIACGVLKVPLLPFAGTLALGSVPWNAITAQVGELLLEVVQALPDVVASGTLVDGLDQGGFADAPAPGTEGLTRPQRLHLVANKAQGGARAIAAHIWKPEMLTKLVLLSLVSLAPMLLQRYLKQRQAKLEAAAIEHEPSSELDEMMEFEHEADSDIEMDAQLNEEDEVDTSFATLRQGEPASHRSTWAPERLRSAWAWDDSACSGLTRSASLSARNNVTALGQRFTHERQNTDAGQVFAKTSSPVFDFDDVPYEETGNDEADNLSPYDAIIKLENESSEARRTTITTAA